MIIDFSTGDSRDGGTSLDSPEISSHKTPSPPPTGEATKAEPVSSVIRPRSAKRLKAIARAVDANNKMAAELAKMCEWETANELKRCGVTKQLWICGGCGQTSYVNYSCHRRICALCAYRISTKRAHAVKQLFLTMKNPKWLTLTMERSDNLAAGVARIRKAFAKWRRLKAIKRRIDGGIYQIECKPKADGWHIHLHALIDSLWLPKPLIWRTWAYALKQKIASVDIQGNLSGRKIAHYITKYATKPAEIGSDNPGAALEYLETLSHARLFGTFGSCHNALPKDETKTPLPCPHCGATREYMPFTLGYIIYGGDEWKLIAAAVQGDNELFIPRIPEEPPALFDTEQLPF